MLAIVAFSLRAPFLPFYLSDLGATTTEAQALWSGMINAAGAGVMAVSAPFWGAFADRHGRKPMLLRAMLAAMVTIGLMALAQAPWHLLVLRLVEGSLTGTVAAATALVAAGTPKERLGFGLGLIQTAVFSGASLGPLAGGLLADQLGYRPTFLVASLMMAGAAGLVFWLVQEEFTPGARAAAGAGRFGGSFALIFTRALLPLVVAITVIRLTSMAVQPILPLFVEELSGITGRSAATLAGLTIGVAGVTSAVSAVTLGRLGDRVGHRRTLLWCTLAAGLLYLPMAAAQAIWQLVVLQALFGFAAGGLMPSVNALIANATPAARRGAVYGALAAAGSLGAFVGPLMGATLAAAFGFPAALLATGVLLLALAAGLALNARQEGVRVVSAES
jgi:DHA1 family multidrug resistance protein-like MFS transporter